LEPLLARQIDTLILGCTHYPLLRQAIAQVTGGEIALVDSASCCAEYVAEGLRQMGRLCANRDRPGRLQPFVTDDSQWFDHQCGRFLGEAPDPAGQVMLPIIEMR
jgi:glutamate racemase